LQVGEKRKKGVKQGQMGGRTKGGDTAQQRKIAQNRGALKDQKLKGGWGGQIEGLVLS